MLPLTDTAIEDYQQHIKQYPETNSEIKAYLTRHINGLMCAEIERSLTSLIRERLERGSCDAATANFMKSISYGSPRNAQYKELKKILCRFGVGYEKSLDRRLSQIMNEGGIEKLGVAVAKRNQNAHDNPPDITFRELKEAFAVANAIVEAVQITFEEQF